MLDVWFITVGFQYIDASLKLRQGLAHVSITLFDVLEFPADPAPLPTLPFIRAVHEETNPLPNKCSRDAHHIFQADRPDRIWPERRESF